MNVIIVKQSLAKLSENILDNVCNEHSLYKRLGKKGTIKRKDETEGTYYILSTNMGINMHTYDGERFNHLLVQAGMRGYSHALIDMNN